jgi:hypothetical protein
VPNFAGTPGTLTRSSSRSVATSTSGVNRPLPNPPATTVILCECWPGWLFTCGALQLHCTHVFIWSAATTWATNLSMRFSAVHFQFNSTGLPPVDSHSLILAQGSVSWFERLLLSRPPTNPVLFSATMSTLSVPPVPMKGFQQFMFSSTAAGSVVDAPWLFWSRGLSTPIPPSAYQRSLRHILNAATRCDAFRSCRSDSQDYMALLRLPLPVGRVLAWHFAPSVFVSTGWLKRPLSVPKLALAFDVPASFLHCFESIPRHRLPWLSSAPVKLLLHVGGG